MKRTREQLIAVIEYQTKWDEDSTKLYERLAKKAEEARKELKELDGEENERSTNIQKPS